MLYWNQAPRRRIKPVPHLWMRLFKTCMCTFIPTCNRINWLTLLSNTPIFVRNSVPTGLLFQSRIFRPATHCTLESWHKGYDKRVSEGVYESIDLYTCCPFLKTIKDLSPDIYRLKLESRCPTASRSPYYLRKKMTTLKAPTDMQQASRQLCTKYYGVGKYCFMWAWCAKTMLVNIVWTCRRATYI